MLLVAANLVSISYDADDQDELPPVTVELKFLPQSPRVEFDHRSRPVHSLPVFSTSHRVDRVLQAMHTRPQLEKGSPQLLVPLLC